MDDGWFRAYARWSGRLRAALHRGSCGALSARGHVTGNNTGAEATCTSARRFLNHPPSCCPRHLLVPSRLALLPKRGIQSLIWTDIQAACLSCAQACYVHSTMMLLPQGQADTAQVSGVTSAANFQVCSVTAIAGNDISNNKMARHTSLRGRSDMMFRMSSSDCIALTKLGVFSFQRHPPSKEEEIQEAFHLYQPVGSAIEASAFARATS